MLSEYDARLVVRDLQRGTLKLLEGVVLPLYGWRLERLRAVTFRNVEFGSEAAGGRFSQAEWRDCTLVDSKIDPLKFIKTTVVGCEFERIECGRDYLPAFSKSTFEECTFTASRFAGLLVRRCRFTRVRFDDVRMKEPFWSECDFADVVMTGRYERAHLVRCDFTRTDLGELTMPEATIRANRRADVVLPTKDASFMVSVADLGAALTAAEPEMAAASRVNLQELREQQLPHGQNGLDIRIGGAEDIMWSGPLLSSIFGLEPSDSQLLVDLLRHKRQSSLPTHDTKRR